MSQGYLSLVLHAHLPYVRHPEHDAFFEENWLFEALTECYLPLIGVFDRLHHDQIPFRLTLSLSPTLITMLEDDLLRERYLRHLRRMLELADKEIHRTRGLPQLSRLTRFYQNFLAESLDVYETQYQCDLLQAFQKHQNTGKLELITCAATHGFLPLLSVNQMAVANQIKVGIDCFQSRFGRPPEGFWLPECGYYPGLESILADFGIRYFFVDSHGILHASQKPVSGVYAPLDCGNGVAAFGRDPESSRQVWSSHEGYPGDVDYREYYRDIGFDLDLDYIGPYLLEQKIRINTGFKYHRITGQQDSKALYDRQRALAKAHLHASDFVAKKIDQVKTLHSLTAAPPHIVAPFDAELFGHWWFEGPHWLEQVIRLASQMPDRLELITCSDYLTRHPDLQCATPSASSWGDRGYSRHWINETNQWIYPHLHRAASRMEQLACQYGDRAIDPLLRRALNQAARSLLLAQSSDWPFILKTGTTTEYAKKRITDHLARFNYLTDCIVQLKIDEYTLTALETLDKIFPDIDFRDYCPGHKLSSI